jgi:hydroxyacylglutathione hydrolase
MGGGFNCTRSGTLIGADGHASGILFNLGPGRLGTLLESIAIPEIRNQAVEVAAILATQLANEEDADLQPSRYTQQNEPLASSMVAA